MRCEICGEGRGKQHVLREMMFATGDEFCYWECSGCGCLQIVEIPTDMGRYYPGDYYAPSRRVSQLQLWLHHTYHRAPRLGRLLRPAGMAFESIQHARLRPGARILDVGCGSGKLVTILRYVGFDAHGIDPFTETETEYVKRTCLEETTTREWDLIMFQHSLEHMDRHIGVLRSARERLSGDGICLVRIPLANWTWAHYREHWAQLDPPRHFVLHTPQSFRLAAEAAGLRISRTLYDSGAFQFYQSELYRENSPMVSESSAIARLGRPAIRKFRRRAAELNRQQLGDQAAFYLEKATPSMRPGPREE